MKSYGAFIAYCKLYNLACLTRGEWERAGGLSALSLLNQHLDGKFGTVPVLEVA